MDKLLTVQEAAEVLNCHPQSIYRNKELPKTKIRGIGLRFKLKELEKYLENRTVSPTSSLSSDFLQNTEIIRDNSLPTTLHRRILCSGGESEMPKGKNKTRFNFGYGAIYQRKTKNGKIRWYLDYRNGDGKRIQRVATNALSAKEAQQSLKDAIHKEHNRACGINPTKTISRFIEYADLFLENYSKPNKKSWECDHYAIEAHLKPFFGHLMMKEITPLLIEKFKAEKLKSGLKKSSTNRLLALLKTMFSIGSKWKIIGDNPVKSVKMFSEKDNLKERILDSEEEKRLLSESADHLRPIILTSLHTGMRKMEVLNLTWDKVDFKERIIHVEKTKSGRNRIVPINDFLFVELLKLKEKARSEYVFTNPENGNPLKNVRRGFENACRRASIEKLRWHDLRHTFSCRLVQKGCDIETLRALLGHHSITITERYIHTNKSQKKQAVDLLVEKEQKTSHKRENLLHIRYTKEKESTTPLFSVN
ncbi:tyrosine-type recombinase/integrase [Acidobacteriota bacterium]